MNSSPDSTRHRLDMLLVQQGLARSRSHAVTMIRDGAVLVAGVVASKPGMVIANPSQVYVHRSAMASYVSRAAFKLVSALDALDHQGPTISGQICLDIGASTGGFTQVLLHRGAREVFAIDVGHDQLAPEIRHDERVRVLEGVNARDLTAQHISASPDLIVADISFISLTIVIPALRNISAEHTQLLLMVKPQFEVGRTKLGRNGVVRDDTLHLEAIESVITAAKERGYGWRAIIPSALPGPAGNREYFVWFDQFTSFADPRAAATGAVHWLPHPESTPPVSWAPGIPRPLGNQPLGES